jgi:t-SNARE complex subunit (syntaxin)
MAESKKSLLQQEREQDEQADRLHSGVLRIKEQAGLIKRELDDQNVILEKLEEDVDKAEGNMSALNKKMRTMVEEAKNSDKAMYTVIICLMILLGVLTMMVLS